MSEVHSLEPKTVSDRSDLEKVLTGQSVQVSDLYLRRADAKDCDRIAAFHVRIWRQTYLGLAPEPAVQALDFERRQAQWGVKLSGNRNLALTLLVEDGQGQILGLCDLTQSEISGFSLAVEITNLYLDSAVRGQGLGRYFLQLAKHWARVCDLPDLVLAVVRENRSACDFYRGCGGEPAAEQQDKGPLWRSDNIVMRWSSGV